MAGIRLAPSATRSARVRCAPAGRAVQADKRTRGNSRRPRPERQPAGSAALGKNTKVVPLLYVDLLGMKARYQTGGVRSAKQGYRLLGELVASGLAALPEARPVSGGVQSDAAALQFASAADAVTVGKTILQECLRRSARNRRVWMRGVIMRGGGPDAELTSEVPLDGCPDGIFERHFSDTLLRAVNAEQSGFRGQRLLIEGELVTPRLVESLGVSIGDGTLAPAHRLVYSVYPTGMEDFVDVLWPVSDDISAWPGTYRRLVDRLRWSARGGEHEISQSAATHLLFTEIDSIIHALGGPSATPGAA